ncbi:hypothetical protein [Komagataeibacter europaeus]|nr:hypothetical protein [Komagataeibacter europaeus]
MRTAPSIDPLGLPRYGRLSFPDRARRPWQRTGRELEMGDWGQPE